jgi:hypothetical protein
LSASLEEMNAVDAPLFASPRRTGRRHGNATARANVFSSPGKQAPLVDRDSRFLARCKPACGKRLGAVP